jgi:hypothetical protein
MSLGSVGTRLRQECTGARWLPTSNVLHFALTYTRRAVERYPFFVSASSFLQTYLLAGSNAPRAAQAAEHSPLFLAQRAPTDNEVYCYPTCPCCRQPWLPCQAAPMRDCDLSPVQLALLLPNDDVVA